MQIPRSPSRMLALGLLLGLGSSVAAFHQETLPLTAITSEGDTDLPHIPSQGRRLLALAEGQYVVTHQPFGFTGVRFSALGRDPAVSANGYTVAWETNADPGLSGWQIGLWQKGTFSVPVPDPSGTSANPSLDKVGLTLVFESAGNLTYLPPTDVVNRVYVRLKDGTLRLASSGSGWSGNAMLAAKGGLVTFESTSDPATGADTGTTQIWAGRVTSLPAAPITNGSGPSTDPIVSDDGRLVAFVSRAALGTDGADTSAPQIFVYDTRTQTFAQLTDETSGCGRAGVSRVNRDWRITFVCDGRAYYHMLRENMRYHVPTPDGSTQAILPIGAHFVIVSTTADLMAGSGTTPGHRIYLRNLFKAPVSGVTYVATWFPFQGIPDF